MSAPSLFALMGTLTAEQRQKFGEWRRGLLSSEGAREEMVLDRKTRRWYLRYWKGRKKIAEARFGPHSPEFKKI